MNTEYEAVAQLKFAENRLEKARNLLNAEIEKSEISDENHLNRAVVEESFVASIDAVNKISFALEELESAIHPQEVEYEAKNVFQFSAEFDDKYGFHFKFSRLPNLKSKRGVSRLSERFVIEAGQKIMDAIPPGYVQMGDAYVIFVSHFAKTGPHQSRYFDNDNLDIKAILDVIVLLVCIDDATRYCDNLYLSQDDPHEYSELFIISKSNLKAWAESNSHLDFARTIV